MKFTLVIPTHNRPTYLRRNLIYLGRMKFDNKLVIADSSDSEIAAVNKKAVEEMEGVLDIDYFCMEGADSYTRKVLKALGMVNTEMVMMCGDDDFIIPDKINECVDFLHENETFSIASGEIAEFRKTRLLGNKTQVWREYPQRQILDDAPIVRVQDYLRRYRPNWYSVHRTKNLYRNFDSVFSKSMGRPLWERLLCISDVIDGKCKLLPGLFLIREKGMTLTDEQGNRTWPDGIGKTELVSRENLNFELYEASILDSLIRTRIAGRGLAPREVDNIRAAISDDFDKWAKKKNKQVRLLSIMGGAVFKTYLSISHLRARVRSAMFLSKLGAKDRKAIREVVSVIEN